MIFLQTYWPQIVIVVALLVVIVIFIRRMPKTQEQIHVATKTVSPKRDIRGGLSTFWTKVKEFFSLLGSRASKMANRLKEFVLRKKKREEASAVSKMFDGEPVQSGAASAKPESVVAPAKSILGKEELKTVPKRPLGSRFSMPTLRRKSQTDEIEKKRLADELIRRAKQYLHEGRAKDAESTFIEAVTLNPRDERIYIELGTMYLNTDNYNDARSSFAEAHKLKGDDVDVLSKLGLIAYRLKKYDEAVKRYEEAAKLQPLEPKHVANLGLALRASGNIKKALKNYAKAFEMKQGEVDYAVRACELALELSKPKKAEPFLQAIEKLDPTNVKLAELRTRYTEMNK